MSQEEYSNIPLVDYLPLALLVIFLLFVGWKKNGGEVLKTNVYALMGFLMGVSALVLQGAFLSSTQAPSTIMILFSYLGELVGSTHVSLVALYLVFSIMLTWYAYFFNKRTSQLDGIKNNINLSKVIIFLTIGIILCTAFFLLGVTFWGAGG